MSRCVPLLATLALGVLVAAAPAQEHSVRPGANDYYLAPDVDVGEWVRRFEGESREVHAERHAIVAALGLQPGMRVADVGAGTGLFVPLLAHAVGEHGRVYAVDIAPAFVAHLEARVREAGLAQVSVVQGDARSTMLPAGSLDVVFLCDVYHHLEFPQDVLASIRRALMPGGRLVVVDFEREPGHSRPWILEHVRAGRATVSAEIEAAGFVRRETGAPRGLVENYMLAFERP